MALQLQKLGIRRVRPLLGGVDGWVAKGYPVEKIGIAAATTVETPVTPSR